MTEMKLLRGDEIRPGTWIQHTVIADSRLFAEWLAVTKVEPNGTKHVKLWFGDRSAAARNDAMILAGCPDA